jgi:excisionase family DNA binding protein
MGEDHTLYLSTGKSAKALGLSADSVRRLCHAGQIEGAVLTPGGQWRIPTEEVDRLRDEGVPPVPAPLPSRNPRLAEASPGGDNDKEVSGGRDYLLADPSEETIAAADTVVRLESEVRALELRRQKEQTLDWFRSRQADEDARARESAEEAEALAAEERERDRRTRFQTRWVEYALASLPPEWEGEGLEVRVHARVKDALSKLDPGEPDGIVERILSGVVVALTRPHRRRKEIESAIEEAVNELPYSAGNWAERARESARAAVAQLGDDSPMREVRQAALAAVRGVLAQYHEAKRADADATERERLIRFVPLELGRHYSEAGVEAALNAIKEGFDRLPMGTQVSKLEQVRDEVLAPWRKAVADRAASLRAEVAARQKRQLEELQARLRPKPATIHPAPIIRRSPASR